jgi:protein SCO1/2
LCAGIVLGCGDKPAGSAAKASFRSIDITGAEYARRLELLMPRQTRSLGEFKGKVVVVFFGYAMPDVCPTDGRAFGGQAFAR